MDIWVFVTYHFVSVKISILMLCISSEGFFNLEVPVDFQISGTEQKSKRSHAGNISRGLSYVHP